MMNKKSDGNPGFPDEELKKGINPKSLTIGLLVFPLRNPEEKAGQAYLAEFINMLSSLTKEVLVITGNYYPNSIQKNVKIANVRAMVVKEYGVSIISRTSRLLRAQLTLSLKLIQLNKKIDVVILLCMTGPVFLPTLVARIMRKKIIVAMAGSHYQGFKVVYKPPLVWFVSSVLWLIEQINYALASKIIVTSDSLISELEVNRYCKDKVIAAYILSSYLDTDHFRIKVGLAEREHIVGYVGRLSLEKGVIEFAKAIPLILSRNNDIRFLIVGDGPLMGELKQVLKDAGCFDKVNFKGWVPPDRVTDYLNKMRFHLLPSGAEMLGAVTIQAMACGAIVIANSVGGIPDVIIEGKTGFLLKDNSPQSIADKIIEVWGHPRLDKIQKDARTFVEQNFSYELALAGWRYILNNLYSDSRCKISQEVKQ